MAQYTNEEIVQVTGTVIVDGSASTQPVSGTVDIGTMPEVEIKNDAGNPVPVSGTVTANAGTGPFPVSDNGGSLTVDGTVAISGSVAVTGPLTDTQLRATPVPVSFSQAALVPTVSSVSVTTSATTLAAANSARQKLIIFNETGTLFVKLGAAASGTDYTYRLTANTLLEIDFAQTLIVTGIKQSGTSNVQVTSLV